MPQVMARRLPYEGRDQCELVIGVITQVIACFITLIA